MTTFRDRSSPATFVKELIYRSLERNNLDKVYRQILELRKRLRNREQKAVSALAVDVLRSWQVRDRVWGPGLLQPLARSRPGGVSLTGVVVMAWYSPRDGGVLIYSRVVSEAGVREGTGESNSGGVLGRWRLWFRCLDVGE